jgi:hypothetical protein
VTLAHRLPLIAALLVSAAACFLMSQAIGRAIDHETRQFAILTQNGQTVECERITDITGRTFYDSCVRVP